MVLNTMHAMICIVLLAGLVASQVQVITHLPLESRQAAPHSDWNSFSPGNEIVPTNRIDTEDVQLSDSFHYGRVPLLYYKYWLFQNTEFEDRSSTQTRAKLEFYRRFREIWFLLILMGNEGRWPVSRAKILRLVGF